MSKIEVSEKNDWILAVILLLCAAFLWISLEGCTATKHYSYKVTFNDGSVEYYELTYKVKKGSKVIEYDGDVIFGVDTVEMIK